MKQFFYKRIETIKLDDSPDKTIEYLDSFSIDMIIRSIEKEDGGRLVLLKDIHERSMDVPDISPKTNKMIGMKRQRDVFQSEINLLPEDNIRFKNLD